MQAQAVPEEGGDRVGSHPVCIGVDGTAGPAAKRPVTGGERLPGE